MTKIMLIDAQHADETRVVITHDGQVEDYDFVTLAKPQLKGNIYLAKITRIEPSLQAAFVEYGGNKQGFLPFSEIHPDYYQIPTEDRMRLLQEEEEALEREESEEDDERDESGEPRTAQGEREDRGRRRGGKYGRRRRRGPRPQEGQEGAEGQEASATQEEGAAQDAQETDYAPLEAEIYETSSAPVVENDDAEHENASASQGRDHHPRDHEEKGDDELETISASDADDAPRRARGQGFKRYRIQEVIKRNQIVLVQVIKEERGNKGCSLTTYISLAGRYCVLMPNSPKGGGVSRKIGNGEQRRKLKEVIAELKEKRGLSAIVRTAGIDRTKTEIKRDYEYLVKVWSQIREDTLASQAPKLIYEESDIIKRSIRDVYSTDIEQVCVQGEQAYKDAKNFMKLIMPSHAARVKQYKEPQPLFAAYGVESQLASMYEPVAKLPSGGYVVLQPTEALISIDVNSGRSTTERNVEETAIKTNLEAAYEIARQLRLRDLAGLIVIDFIDMYYGKNRRTLEKALKDALKADRAKIQLGRISPFGLMELSRQRMRPSIAESSTITCPHCKGVGFVRSVETIAMQIIRVLEREVVVGGVKTFRIVGAQDLILHLMNDRREKIQALQTQFEVHIRLDIDSDVALGEFRLFKVDEEGRETLHKEQSDQGNRRKGRRGRRGGKARGPMGDESSIDQGDDEADDIIEEGEVAETQEDEAEEGSKAQADNKADGDKREGRRRSRRGGRNRRGRRDRIGGEGEASPEQAGEDGETIAAEQREPVVVQLHASEDHGVAVSQEASEPEPDESPAPKPAARKRAPTRRARKDTASAQTEEESSHADAPAPAMQDGETEDQSAEEAAQSKRKGWWNRVLES